MTLNLGKINVQIEKQGSAIKIDLKIESRDKETSIKEGLDDLSAQLKQLGYEQVDINIDLESGSKDETVHSQETIIETKKTNNERINQTTEAPERERDFGYNSFEYTA